MHAPPVRTTRTPLEPPLGLNPRNVRANSSDAHTSTAAKFGSPRGGGSGGGGDGGDDDNERTDRPVTILHTVGVMMRMNEYI